MCLSGFRRHQTTSDLMLVGLGSSHWTPLSPPKRGPRVPCIFVTATPPWTIQTTPCCMCSASITSPPAPPLPLPTCQVMCRGTWPAPPPPHAQWTRPRRPKHGRIFGLREQPPEFSWGGGCSLRHLWCRILDVIPNGFRKRLFGRLSASFYVQSFSNLGQ